MTIILNHLVPHTYQDSVMLMEVSTEIEEQVGVLRALVLMATRGNMDLLHQFNLLVIEPEDIPSDGIVLAVEADSETDAQRAIEIGVQRILTPKKRTPSSAQSNSQPGPGAHLPAFYTWKEAPEEARVAVISIPGQYATAEAFNALKANRHVVLFSNNVSIEDELALKMEAKKRHLLMLGPECGTAILAGVPMAFANIIRPGDIGITAASGSGLQEVTCLIDRWGGGITHAIGTGGRDLSAAIGGLAMQAAIDLLDKDEKTRVMVLLSKPPSPLIADSIIKRAKKTGKPTVVCFLGLEQNRPQDKNLIFVSTLEEAASSAVQLAGGQMPRSSELPLPCPNWGQKQVYLRGLYSGGTLAYEAMVVLQKTIGPIYSNAPLNHDYQLEKGQRVEAHTCLDLGTEEYTTGLPHPMIDGRYRSELITSAGQDPSVGVILLDIILGLGGDMNPVGSILNGIKQAQSAAAHEDRPLYIIASVTGTEQDPQGFEKQVGALKAAGVIVAESNAAASRLAAHLLKV